MSSTKTQNKENALASFLVKSVYLLLLSLCYYFAGEVMGEHFFVSLRGQRSNHWMHGLWALPLATILFVGISTFLKYKELRIAWVMPLLFIAYFIILMPYKIYAIVFVLLFVLLFVLQHFFAKSEKLKTSYLILSVFLMYIPLFYYPLKNANESTNLIFAIEVFKATMVVRFFGWVVERNIYKRKMFTSLWEYLEYMFCPFFFVYPGQINFFMYDYFHKSKLIICEAKQLVKNFMIGLWGLLLILLFSYGNFLFWTHIESVSSVTDNYRLFGIHLCIGFYWLIMIYLLQAGGMSFQVSMARFLGYQISYDMNYPLLARSPLDYFMRHSYYVRDFIFQVGMQPLALKLLRSNWPVSLVYPLSALLSYSVFIIPQTGYRSDFERTWEVTFSLIGILSFYIILSVVYSLVSKKSSVTSAQIMSLHLSDKKIINWNWKDFLFWILTLLVLSASKSLLGLAKYYSMGS